jgi:hypothetical protein
MSSVDALDTLLTLRLLDNLFVQNKAGSCLSGNAAL